jgi:hypothetical protein
MLAAWNSVREWTRLCYTCVRWLLRPEKAWKQCRAQLKRRVVLNRATHSATTQILYNFRQKTVILVLYYRQPLKKMGKYFFIVYLNLSIIILRFIGYFGKNQISKILLLRWVSIKVFAIFQNKFRHWKRQIV